MIIYDFPENKFCNNRLCIFYASECRDYVNITDPTRSVEVDTRNTGTLLCDIYENWLTNSDWIRFSMPNKTRMPEYCPPTHACNTHAPGWLYGRHPAVEDGAVQMLACFHWKKRRCYWHYSISVRNCTNFYVYRLSRISTCYLRLCVGKLWQGLAREAWIESDFRSLKLDMLPLLMLFLHFFSCIPSLVLVSFETIYLAVETVITTFQISYFLLNSLLRFIFSALFSVLQICYNTVYVVWYIT